MMSFEHAQTSLTELKAHSLRSALKKDSDVTTLVSRNANLRDNTSPKRRKTTRRQSAKTLDYMMTSVRRDVRLHEDNSSQRR